MIYSICSLATVAMHEAESFPVFMVLNVQKFNYLFKDCLCRAHMHGMQMQKLSFSDYASAKRFSLETFHAASYTA